jgi:hypothetical protein
MDVFDRVCIFLYWSVSAFIAYGFAKADSQAPLSVEEHVYAWLHVFFWPVITIFALGVVLPIQYMQSRGWFTRKGKR